MPSTNSTDLPPDDCDWKKNDPTSWPKTSYEDLVEYLIESKAYDGKDMRAFRSLYAYNYVQNGWLGDVEHVRIHSVTFVKAQVSPSQPGTGRVDYRAWVAFEEDGHVRTASCSCPAGLGRACSHISAIIYAISLAWTHGMAGQTCTDKTVAWGRGSAKALQPDKLQNINFSKPRSSGEPSLSASVNTTSELYEPASFSNHQDFKDYVSNSPVSRLWNCPGTMLHRILNAPPVAETASMQTPSHDSHDMDFTVPVSEPNCKLCKTFYEKYIKLSKNACTQLTTMTTDQSRGANSGVWHDSRKLRIPSSKLGAVPKTARANPNNFVKSHLYPRFKGSVDTKHGLANEANARRDFEATAGVEVKQCGTIICKEEPYFSCSPDGIVDENTNLEIKCPTRAVTELVRSGKYDVTLCDGEYSLKPKGKNGYYAQVQLAMYCTGAKLCKFFLWSSNPSEQICIDVHFDHEFLTDILANARKFYFQHLLVRIVDDYHAKRLSISQGYLSLCGM